MRLSLDALYTLDNLPVVQFIFWIIYEKELMYKRHLHTAVCTRRLSLSPHRNEIALNQPPRFYTGEWCSKYSTVRMGT